MSGTSRDNFSTRTASNLAKRASYICSNPDCRALTIAPSNVDPNKSIFIGEAAHITAAAPNGPRHDESLSEDERKSIENAIFLCRPCARMIDANNGLDYSADMIRTWKKLHEDWVRGNLNKSPNALITTVDGEHVAEGKGDVIALDIQAPVFLKPGTKSIARGEGSITATRIGKVEKE